MAYTKQTWGTYKYDESKTLAENIAAADKANALVTVDKIKHIEDGIADKAEKGDPGAPGKPGDKGDPGEPGGKGIGVKSIALVTDADGKVTSGTLTTTDNKTSDITVTQAGA